MTDEELIAKFQERVAAGETDLRPLGELIFGKFDQDWPARLIALARRGAATQWGPIENLADLPLRASYLGGWKDEQGKIRPGSIFQKYTQNPNRHSFISHFIPLAALDQTP